MRIEMAQAKGATAPNDEETDELNVIEEEPQSQSKSVVVVEGLNKT